MPSLPSRIYATLAESNLSNEALSCYAVAFQNEIGHAHMPEGLYTLPITADISQ